MLQTTYDSRSICLQQLYRRIVCQKRGRRSPAWQPSGTPKQCVWLSILLGYHPSNPERRKSTGPLVPGMDEVLTVGLACCFGVKRILSTFRTASARMVQLVILCCSDQNSDLGRPCTTSVRRSLFPVMMKGLLYGCTDDTIPLHTACHTQTNTQLD